MMDNALLTEAEIANRLQISRDRVKTLTDADRIPVVRLGPRIRRYIWADVLTALQAATASEGAADE